MNEMLAMSEISSCYPNEWLLIADTELDEDLNIVKGEVVAHSSNRDEVYGKLTSIKGRSFAIEYVGEPPEDWAVVL
ncbi:MAG: hypothetical protein ACRD82_09830 [Blastocatellia bacterium]